MLLLFSVLLFNECNGDLCIGCIVFVDIKNATISERSYPTAKNVSNQLHKLLMSYKEQVMDRNG